VERVVANRQQAPAGWAPSTLLGLAAAFVAAVGAMWATHGGLVALTEGWRAALTSLTSLTGLLASAAGLVGVALVTRPRQVEAAVGLDRVFAWHRRLGAAACLLVGAHVAAAVASSSMELGPAEAISELTGRQPYMAMATVGAALVGLVTITSIRVVRRRMSYETWYFVHLTAYFGLALAFAHQIFVGTDFVDDAIARLVWIGVHVAVVAAVLWGRWGRLFAAATHPLTVVSATREGEDTSSLWLGSKSGRAVDGQAGQFVLVRALRPRLWWHAHPFSLSAAPRDGVMRVTVKERGDATRELARLPIGSRVVVEGPYGAITPAALGDKPPLFVVGGVGIAPALALVETLGPDARPVVLWRARREQDLVHRHELERAVASRGGRVAILLGPTATLAANDPFSATSLRAAVPDVATRTAVICGPERLLHAARRGLLAAGVSPEDIHFERPWW
jgi:predicted ferric reductase